MLRLKGTKHANTATFLESAIRIAEHYGFRPLEEASRKDAAELRQMRKRIGKNEPDFSLTRKEERSLVTSAKRCVSLKRAPEEHLLLWRAGNDAKGNVPHVFLELHIIGASSAIAEALLIVVANSIAEEAGLEKRTISVNNIGSKESSSRFVRDVAAFLRKHIESISPNLRPRAAVDPLGTLMQLIERGHPAIPRAPQAMEYLTEEERRRFWDLLEYIEVFGLTYELSPTILGSRDCWAHSLFQISATDAESGSRMRVAFGGRYDPLAARFAASPTAAAMVSLTCEVRGRTRPKRELLGFPSIYFAHLGPEARRRALGVLENLRQAGIPVHHGLCHERIGEQMMVARRHAVPYILIMGHKEAVEGTILVREVATNSQDAIPLPELAGYLKRRRVGGLRMETAA
jgi:histidyl-tRNA synthetase